MSRRTTTNKLEYSEGKPTFTFCVNIGQYIFIDFQYCNICNNCQPKEYLLPPILTFQARLNDESFVLFLLSVGLLRMTNKLKLF